LIREKILQRNTRTEEQNTLDLGLRSLGSGAFLSAHRKPALGQQDKHLSGLESPSGSKNETPTAMKNQGRTVLPAEQRTDPSEADDSRQQILAVPSATSREKNHEPSAPAPWSAEKKS
jgi:hypothetical protein